MANHKIRTHSLFGNVVINEVMVCGPWKNSIGLVDKQSFVYKRFDSQFAIATHSSVLCNSFVLFGSEENSIYY